MPLEVLAVILGIFYTIRKLDAVDRSPEDFPHVARGDFLAWQAKERAAYNVAALACVLKLTLGLGFQYLIAPRLHLYPKVVFVVGASIDLSWIFVVFRTWWLSSKLRKERARLGIWLGMRGAPESESPHKGEAEEDLPPKAP
jgi:hypothetical protein